MWAPFCIALTGLFAVLTVAAELPTHLIPPGYQPEMSDEERGLWLEMKEFEEHLKRSPMLVRDPALNEVVTRIGCRVAGPYCPDIRIYILRNPAFNASMAPNGMMQVWTGLLLRVRSQDELASILGHEIAHYTRTDTLKRMRRLRKSLTTGSIFSLGLGVLTGVRTNVGEMAAIMNTLAFSREQESDADFLGASMMADAGFDPEASYEVWEMLIEEENYAVARGEEPSIFWRTHPPSEERALALHQFVANLQPVDIEERGPDPFLAVVSDHYVQFMEDQIDTNRFGRTEAILIHQAQKGVDPAMIAFFKGEMYRQRNAPGDTQLAIESYLQSCEGEQPYADAHRNLGYLYLKLHDRNGALEQFRQYLDLKPMASDREMIEFYLENQG